MLGHVLQEFVQCLLVKPGAGRVVRVGDKHHASLGIDGRQHRRQVMAPVLGRNHASIRSHRLGHDRVDRKRVFAEHRVQTWRQVGTADQFKDVVGAVAQGHLIQLDPALVRQ